MNALDSLKSEMLRPHSDLAPLFRFRGPYNINNPLAANRMHAYWNFVHAMRLNECEALTDGTRLYRAGELPHLCGFHSQNLPLMSLRSFVSRLRLSPKVTAIVPGFTDYVSMILPQPWELQVIGSELSPSDPRWSRNGALHKRNTKVMRELNRSLGKSADVRYLFGAGAKDQELMAAVHKAVPGNMKASIRNDLCQDLLCAIIAGELKVENLPYAVKRFASEAYKFQPRSYEDFAGAHYNKEGSARGAEDWKEFYTPPPLPLEDQVDLLRQEWADGPEEQAIPVDIVSPMARTPKAETLAEEYLSKRKRLSVDLLGQSAIDTRNNECLRKTRYDSESSARRGAMKLEAMRPSPTGISRVYNCPWCRNWHLSSNAYAYYMKGSDDKCQNH